MVPCKRSCCKEYTHAIWKPCLFWLESLAKVKDFQKWVKLQCHKVQNYGTKWKVLSQKHMCNMKALPVLVWKLWPRLNFSKVGQTSRSQCPKLWYQVKVLSQEIHMCNMKAMHLLVWKLWPRLMFLSTQWTLTLGLWHKLPEHLVPAR